MRADLLARSPMPHIRSSSPQWLDSTEEDRRVIVGRGDEVHLDLSPPYGGSREGDVRDDRSRTSCVLLGYSEV